MANPGTAVTRLFVEGPVAGQGQNPVRPANDDSSSNKEFEDFFKEHGLEGAARESGLIGKEVTSTVAVTTLAGVTKSLVVGSPNTRVISKQEAVTPSTHGTSQTTRPKPIVIAQPVLLPRPNTQQMIGTPPQQGLQQTPAAIIATPVAIAASPGGSYASSTPGSRKRRADFDGDYLDGSDRKRKRTPARSVDKGGKGLRHFSMKVCEKVQHKGITTYNEVADELVQEFSNDPQRHLHPNDQSYDQKNIRRRVYDALNVLMAMNIISKEKKEIKWVGLPTNSAQECAHLEDQKRDRLERIRQKQLQLQELILQQIAFKNLVERNKKLEKQNGPPPSNAAIHLPFIIVNTSKKTVIDCSISSDKTEYLFNFDNTFEIHDDIEVLKRMGMAFGLEKGSCPADKVKVARSMVPKALEPYVNQLVTGITELAILPSESPGRPHNSQSPIPSQSLGHPLATESSFPTASQTSHSSQRTSRASSTTSMTSNSNRSGHRTHTPSSFGSGSESENETDEEDSHDGFTENSNSQH